MTTSLLYCAERRGAAYGIACAASYHHHGAIVNGYAGARHDDAGALAVLDRDSDFVHDNGGPAGALQHDSASRPGKVAYHDGILRRSLQDDVGTGRNSSQRKHRDLRHQTPVSAHPD